MNPPVRSAHRINLSPSLLSALRDARNTLRTTVRREGSAVIVRVAGEVDAYNEHTWGRLMSEAAAAASPPGPLVVDIDGMDFIGCCAFATLAEEAQRCSRRGIDLRLVSREPSVARVVAASRLDAWLSPLHPTVHAALSATVGHDLVHEPSG